MTYRKTISVLLFLLCAGLSLQAQTNNAPAETPQEKTKFFTKVGYWVLAYTYSGDDFMTERRQRFKESAFAEVYVEPLIDHQNWLFQMLNRVTKVRNDDKQDPYIVFETTFKPSSDNFDEFKVSYKIVGNWGTKNVSVGLDKIEKDTYNQYLANHTYATPSDAQDDLTSAISAALDQLEDKLKSELAPNVLVRYNDEIFWDGHEIDILDTEGTYVTLEAIGKDLRLLNSSDLTWTNADPGPQSTGIVDMTGTSSQTVTLSKKPNDAANTMSVTVKRANMTDDINELLKQLIIEALTAKKKEAQEKIPELKQDSIANIREVAERIARLEAANFPLENDGTTPTPMFTDPMVRADSAFVTDADDARGTAFKELKKRKNIRNDIRKKVNVVALADLIVDQPDQIRILLDALLKNSGRLIAQLLVGKDGDGRREAARNIVVDFLNKNLEQIANTHFTGNIYPEEVIPVEPPSAPLAFDPGRYVYINDLAQFPGRDSLETALNDFLPTLDTPLYVFINYSQDNSRAGFQARLIGGRPVGLPDGARYKVYTFVNMPGSLLEDGYGVNVVSTKRSFVGKVGDDITSDIDVFHSDAEAFGKLLQLIRCASVNGIDEIEMPEDYVEGGRHTVTFRYGLPVASSEVKGGKADYGWWEGTPGARTISGIRSPTIVERTGTISFTNFSIQIPIPTYVAATGVTAFQHLKRYLFPTVADVRDEFDQVWNGGLKAKVASGVKDLSKDDLIPLKQIVSCASRYLDQRSRFDLLKGIINYSTKEWYEDLVLDLIEATPEGADSKDLFDQIDRDPTALTGLIAGLNNDGGNERNFDRLAVEYFRLFIKGYKDQLSKKYAEIKDDHKFYFYGFGGNCEWTIDADRDGTVITFEETAISNVHEKLVGREGLQTTLECDEEEKIYPIGLHDFVAVKFMVNTPFSDQGDIVVLPAAVYYIFIRAYNNDILWKRAEIAWMVIGIVTPIDEFYLLGKAIQYSTRGFKAARLLTVKAMTRQSKLKIAAEHVAELKAGNAISPQKIDDYVEWAENPIVVDRVGEALAGELTRTLRANGATEDGLRTLLSRSNDIPSTVKRLEVTGLKQADLNAFISDLIEETNSFAPHFDVMKLEDIPEYVQAWKVLIGRPRLRLKVDAIESAQRLLANPSRDRLGLTDQIIGQIHASKLADGAFKNIVDDLDDLGRKLNGRDDIEFTNFNSVTGKLIDENPNNSQAAQWMIQDIAANLDDFSKNKTWTFEFPVTNLDGNAARIDFKSNAVPPDLIEYKWLTTVTVKQEDFVREFIKRDLMSAEQNGIEALQWRIKDKKLPLSDFKTYMKSGEAKTALQELLDGADTEGKMRAWFNVKAIEFDLTDAHIDYFAGKYYNSIFK